MIFFISIFIILLSNHYYGYYKIEKDKNHFTEIENFNIKIISPKISINRFYEPNNEEILIKELIEISEPNIDNKTIFIFPEGALAGVNLTQLKYFKNLFSKNYSDDHIIVMGINTEQQKKNYKKIFNSMVVLDNKLNLISEYNKIKLVPFGEFLPFENFLKKFGLKKVGYGYESFSSGKNRNLITLDDKNFNFIPLIC